MTLKSPNLAFVKVIVKNHLQQALRGDTIKQKEQK